jgi:hypothetical protein
MERQEKLPLSSTPPDATLHLSPPSACRVADQIRPHTSLSLPAPLSKGEKGCQAKFNAVLFFNEMRDTHFPLPLPESATFSLTNIKLHLHYKADQYALFSSCPSFSSLTAKEVRHRRIPGRSEADPPERRSPPDRGPDGPLWGLGYACPILGHLRGASGGPGLGRPIRHQPHG